MHHETVRLLTAYNPATTIETTDKERTLALLDQGDPWSRDLPVHLTASALIVHPPTRRVLLRWHARMQAWLQVGGHGDPGERDPLDVVLREAREETGLDDVTPWPDSAVRQIAVLPVPAGATEPAHEHADLRFVLATATPEAARPEKPTAELRWLTLPEAFALVTELNLIEFLNKVGELFDQER